MDTENLPELKALLTLIRLCEGHAYAGMMLTAAYSSAQDVLQNYVPESAPLPPRIRANLTSPVCQDVNQQVESDLRWLAEPQHHVLSLFDEDYPPLLKEIADPPLAIYAVGDVSLLFKKQLAVVGSRKATESGLKTAFDFAAGLAALGLCITSGMALGIDGAAHKGALSVGGGSVAVLGCGLDTIYPRFHERLFLHLCHEGVVVSEYPLGAQARAHHFPQRNRIVTGLSLGTLVVEAEKKSGSLISARLAAEYNREVFAVPGSIYSRKSQGCHQLIKSGAMLAETHLEIADELGLELEVENGAEQGSLDLATNLSEAEKTVLICLGNKPHTIDEILEATAIEMSELLGILLSLEINGLISQTGAEYLLAKAP